MGKSLIINIRRVSKPSNVPPPAGFGLFRVKSYPIHGYGVDLDAVQRGADMWAIVPVWVIETQSFSAVKGNVSMIGQVDIRKLWNLQPADGHTLTEKIGGWLVGSGTGVRPMWTGGPDWQTANAYYVGCQLWAGQLVAASLDTYLVDINGAKVKCRKLYAFRPGDWQLSAEAAPWLYPTCCVARKADNSLSFDFGRGTIKTMLQVLDYPSYEFVGTKKPSAYYVPDEWIVKE